MQYLNIDYVNNTFVLTIDNPISKDISDCQTQGKFKFAGFSYRYPGYYEVIRERDIEYKDKGVITVEQTYLLQTNNLVLMIIEPKNKN